MKFLKFLGLFLRFIAILALAFSAADEPKGHRHTTKNPHDLSKKGWKAAVKRTKEALKDKELGMMAAGLAYYATLTFFPALLGVVTIFALTSSPDDILRAIDSVKAVIPPEIANLVKTQLEPLASTSSHTLGWAAVVSFVFVLWSTSGGVQNLVKATNTTFEVDENRSFIKLRLISLLFSLAGLIGVAIMLSLLVLNATALEKLGMPDVIVTIFPALRWVLLLLLITLGLAVVYRYAPNRPNPRWQIVSWGAVMATILWTVGTIAFFIYVQKFANFGKTYGTFAGIVILMTWFNLSAFITLLGAQVNKKLEEVTDEDL
jgi:membrane protein